ncbi:hypothetical protein F0919_00325 [Taibaiella lutea]|uniref:DUF7674 domain-containing protein n=1 Tax=Taibaiella lutea TaxID=2608001 RepID=A0A5M6CQA6_9BACT|nr:hypothetical protein [Taibaiella lutea]KAA5536152.1 hypothetical protein F0919_00325 [Taibaiella lutea]
MRDNIELTDRLITDAKALNLYGCNPYSICQNLAGYAGELVSKNADEELKKGMDAILSVYTYSGDIKIKTAIENILLYKLSTSIMLSPDRKSIMASIPIPFRKIMNDQICHSGI